MKRRRDKLEAAARAAEEKEDKNNEQEWRGEEKLSDDREKLEFLVCVCVSK